MATIIAGVFFAVVALAFCALTILDLMANAQARVTGGDAGGMGVLFPLAAFASASMAAWLFFT